MPASLTREQLSTLEDFGRKTAKMLGKRPSPTYGVAIGFIASVGSYTYDVLMKDGATLEEVPCLVSALGGSVGDEVRVEFVQGRALVTGVVASESSTSVTSLVPFISDGFEPYTDNQSDYNFPVIARRGSVAMVSGAVKPTSSISSGTTAVVFANLPQQWRPSMRFIAPMQGSGMNRWLLEVCPNGDMSVSRYGTTSYGTIDASNWLVFSATYLI